MSREMRKTGKKNIKVEWCENFIKAVFRKHVPEGGGIYTGCFWDMAYKSGLWERGTYGTPMSEALEELTTVEAVKDANGNFAYHVFKLKKPHRPPGGVMQGERRYL